MSVSDNGSNISQSKSRTLSASNSTIKIILTFFPSHVERNDSGVGSDSGASSSKLSCPEAGLHQTYRDCDASCPEVGLHATCRDCDAVLADESILCGKCDKRRLERKEIISEIVETEHKYGGDLRIIMDEFYRPMLGTSHYNYHLNLQSSQFTTTYN